jgi:DNA-binding response OmpR family regulator
VAAQVLIVDDDPDIVTAIQVNLELEGYGVHVAHDGSEAVEIARQVRPDVVLLDVVMPFVDGHEVLHALHGDTRTRQSKVIFLTAKSSPSCEVRKGINGMVDYIVKPFAPADLLARVRAALEKGSSK